MFHDLSAPFLSRGTLSRRRRHKWNGDECGEGEAGLADGRRMDRDWSTESAKCMLDEFRLPVGHFQNPILFTSYQVKRTKRDVSNPLFLSARGVKCEGNPSARLRERKMTT